jgi:hypothetical protein
MRLITLVLFTSVGCGGGSSGDNDPFATYQDCYNEHHTMEMFSTQRAIEICCIDHPIGGAKMNTVCGDTAQSCTTYVTMNLTDANDPTLTSDISTACSDYVVDRGG